MLAWPLIRCRKSDGPPAKPCTNSTGAPRVALETRRTPAPHPLGCVVADANGAGLTTPASTASATIEARAGARITARNYASHHLTLRHQRRAPKHRVRTTRADDPNGEVGILSRSSGRRDGCIDHRECERRPRRDAARVHARDPAGQLRGPAARDRVHADHLVQALLLLHLPRHRPRAARDRHRRCDRHDLEAPSRRLDGRSAALELLARVRRASSSGTASSRSRRSTRWRSGSTAPSPRSPTSRVSSSSASRCSPRSSPSASSCRRCSGAGPRRSGGCTSPTSWARGWRARSSSRCSGGSDHPRPSCWLAWSWRSSPSASRCGTTRGSSPRSRPCSRRCCSRAWPRPRCSLASARTRPRSISATTTPCTRRGARSSVSMWPR